MGEVIGAAITKHSEASLLLFLGTIFALIYVFGKFVTNWFSTPEAPSGARRFSMIMTVALYVIGTGFLLLDPLRPSSSSTVSASPTPGTTPTITILPATATITVLTSTATIGVLLPATPSPSAVTPESAFKCTIQTPGLCRRWNLALDLRVLFSRPTPTPEGSDSFGNLNVWQLKMSKPQDLTSVLEPLSALNPKFLKNEGLIQFQPSLATDELPAIGMNTYPTTQSVQGIEWRPGRVRVHPQATSSAVIRWRAPFEMSVRITGYVVDIDPSSGDGVGWRISKGGSDNSLNGSTSLAAGAVENGGTAGKGVIRDGDRGVDLLNVSVQKGEFLNFFIDSKGNETHDSTEVEIDITERPPAS
jgi:hypothetical protein